MNFKQGDCIKFDYRDEHVIGIVNRSMNEWVSILIGKNKLYLMIKVEDMKNIEVFDEIVFRLTHYDSW